MLLLQLFWAVPLTQHSPHFVPLMSKTFHQRMRSHRTLFSNLQCPVRLPKVVDRSLLQRLIVLNSSFLLKCVTSGHWRKVSTMYSFIR
ncbi:hypothetical protein DFJ43DRAFT_1052987 [Lentinula guzmanii]|uniref:Secreted protein n=1 Tax=Lentinula guzmanii TaxID=2804957 RepID=A0AA38N4M2_9AGAR|nr:hypothetical protein DFJ43DRAFT_1052987 [Lentinula guzmanii]